MKRKNNNQRKPFDGHGVPNKIEYSSHLFGKKRHEIKGFLKKNLDFGKGVVGGDEIIGTWFMACGSILVPESNLSLFLGKTCYGYLIGTYKDKVVVIGKNNTSTRRGNEITINLDSSLSDGCSISTTIPIPNITWLGNERIMALNYLCSGKNLEDVVQVLPSIHFLKA